MWKACSSRSEGKRPLFCIVSLLFAVTQPLQRRAEVESMKGDLARTKRFLTADKELTAELAESCGGMLLTLKERQKSRAKRDAPWQYRSRCSRHKTFVALFSQVSMVQLSLAIPVPQIQEQIVAGQGVHFAQDRCVVTLFKAERLSTSEFGF